MNWPKFKAVYASRFRPLNEGDGLREWQLAVMPDSIDDETMVAALDGIELAHKRLSDDGARSIAAPRLGEVMRHYHAEHEKRNRYDFPDYDCPDCGKSGWAMGVKHSSGVYAIPGLPPPVKTDGTWYMVHIPCHCKHGDLLNTIEGKVLYTIELRSSLRKYHVKKDADCRELWNKCYDAMHQAKEKSA